ncbi:MAG: putative monooxygenase [Labilithrix sp.]|nr:putative monooxygenase [Labilithrix sp.]
MRTTQAHLASIALALAAATSCGSSGDAGAPAAVSGPPTWYRDIEPLVQTRCDGCHVAQGTGGFPLDRPTAVALAVLVEGRVESGYMPPWPPSGSGAALRDARSLTAAEIALFRGWADAGAPLGDRADHAERAPVVPVLPARAADLELTMPVVYAGPSTSFVTDEVRCFVLDLPGGNPRGASVVATQWRAGTPIGIHSLSGVPLDPAAAAAARAREGADGRAGFECGAGFGDLPHGPPLGANGTGAAQDGSTLPQGTRVDIPAGGAVLMRVHYAVQHLAGALDRSGVRLWLASGAEAAALRPITLATVEAPVELPCPAGLTTDPRDACSREAAFARYARAPATPATVRARADALLASCGTTAAALTAALPFGVPAPEHFFASTTCAAKVTEESVVHVVQGRMNTHGASMRVEVERDPGAWTTLLEIPSWRWAWDAAYVLRDGIRLPAGRAIRVSCTFDNGTQTQWSALSGEPGHDGPARPPLLPAEYIVSADHRAAESCVAYLGVTSP